MRIVCLNLAASGHRPAIWGANLVEQAWINAYSCRATSPPQSLLLLWADDRPASVPSTPAPTPTQNAVTALKSISGLTNEELAPLAGVSRRSLQAWIAGEPISARKDQRLRALCEAVQELSAGNATDTRARILGRAPGDVRPYDLLAEGRYQAAVDVALGRHRGEPAPTPRRDDLAAQLDRREDRVDVPEGRLNRRLSGRLRR